jgi:hypothetical protein
MSVLTTLKTRLTWLAVTICLVGAVFLATGIRPVAADNIVVTLDGKPIDFGFTQPEIVNGRTLVPLREIFEALGFKVTWQQDTQQVIGIKGSLNIVLTVGDTTALEGLDKIALDVPPQIIQGRTMVPLRFIAEAAGTYVSWDGDHNMVRISTNAQTPPSGTPVAQGDYDPGQQLVLDAKVSPTTVMEIVLEPGALVGPAQVSLYTDSADSYRLILGADPITSDLPGFSGFDGARIKAKFTENGTLYIRRPVIVANGELIDNKAYYGKDASGNDTITTCVRVVERDTYLMVNEADDNQWSQVQIAD